MDKNWNVVFTSNELYMAEIVRQMLQNNGIESVVINKLDSVYPSIGHVEVMVETYNQSRAEQLLKEFKS